MTKEDFMLPCLFKKTFGIDCFGCGTQRAFFLVMEGNFYEAFKLFPAIYIMIPLGFFIVLQLTMANKNFHKPIRFLAITCAFVMVFSYFYKIIYN
jgi:Protein of unknown function (DUF2752)